MEKKGKVEGGRERECQRLCSSEIRSYGRWWVLFAYEFSPSVFVWKLFPFTPLGTGLKAEQSFHVQKRSLFPLVCFFTQIRFHFLCFLLVFGLMSGSERVMGKRAGHPLMNTQTRLYPNSNIASATTQAFSSDTWAVKTPIKPVSAHHSIPKTKGLLVREETEPWSKSPSAASEYGKAHYAVRLSVLLAFTGLLTVYIVRRLFTRWSLGGSKESKLFDYVNRKIKCY